MINYTVNPRGIACEHFDDETIILNLPRGNYYSLKGTGQFIWSQLESHVGSDDLADLLADHYGITAAEAGLSLEPFLRQLHVEELIIESEGATAIISAGFVSNTTNQLFLDPVLEVYTDMQDLLMLDPIHDADPGKGWPHQSNA